MRTSSTKAGDGARIRRVREAAGIKTQSDFGKALRVGRSLISELEAGRKPPSQDMYLRLGAFAAENGLHSDAIAFVEKAGFPSKWMVAAVKGALRERRPSKQDDVCLVPATRKIPNQREEHRLPFPLSMLSNPLSTTYVRLTDDFNQPLFKSGDLLLIDEADIDLSKLQGSCVALYRPPSEREYVRLTDRPEKLPQFRRLDGAFAAWLLRQFDSPESDSIEEEGIASFVIPNRIGHPLQHRVDLRGGDIVVLGRVIAWIPKRKESREKRLRRKEKHK
jgi:transcriptional regulator with XRE-family HTH domain